MRKEVSAIAREEFGNALLRGGNATDAVKSLRKRAEKNNQTNRGAMAEGECSIA
jgi:hypothetical protein